MYSCFIQIPQATIRSLALRPIGLNDEDDDEDAIQTVDEVTVQDDFKQNQQHEASGDGKGRDLYGDSLSKSFWDVGDKGHIPSRLDVTLNIASSEEATPNGIWSRFTSLFARRRGRPLSNGKRKIQPSRTAAILMVSLLGVKRSTLAFSSHAGSQDVGRFRELNVFPYFSLQVWPFVAWGLLVISLNAARFSMLSSSSASIALLNIIDSVLLRHHHCFFFALVRTEGG
jgi:hypothetical protein